MVRLSFIMIRINLLKTIHLHVALCESQGVIGSCGTDGVSSSYPMHEANLGSQTTGQSLAFSGPRSSWSPTGSGKARAAQAPEYRLRSCYHTHKVIPNSASFEKSVRAALASHIPYHPCTPSLLLSSRLIVFVIRCEYSQFWRPNLTHH